MKKLLTLLLTLVLIVSCVPMTVGAEGEEDYIPIYTIEDLYNIRNNMSANYKLMNDIDLTEATAPGGDYDYLGNGWDPIGSNGVYDGIAFSGVFDGNGKKITGLRMNLKNIPNGSSAPFYLGLFANLSGSAHNLYINSTISCNHGTVYLGTLSGINTGSVSSVIVTSTINTSHYGNSYIGIICGYNSGAIDYCKSIGSITSENKSTGNSDNHAKEYCGGISGFLSNGNINYSYNEASIVNIVKSGYYNDSGYGTPRVYQMLDGYCGGIVGYSNSSNGRVNCCYNSGSLTVNRKNDRYNNGYISGIMNGIGYISCCYSIGATTGGSNLNKGIGECTISNSYYLLGCGETHVGSKELSETQMLLQSMYAGFDFDNVWVMDVYANYPYPQLRDNPQDLSPRVDSIMIIALPDKCDYMTGENLDPFGGLIEVFFASGESDIFDITEDMITGYDPATVGVQTLTVTYGGQTDSFDITVAAAPEIVGVELTSLPTKTQYIIGSTLELDGAELTVTYDNGETEVIPVTEDMVDNMNLNRLGARTVTVTYEGFEVTFEVTVISNTVQSLTITRLPDKRLYNEGEDLDTTGLEVTAIYTDGRERVATSGFTVTGYDSTPGTKTLTVRYLGKTATFTVTVLEQEEIHEHVWNDGVVTQAPTYYEEGVMTYTCVLCGETRTEVMPIIIPYIKGDLDTDGAISMKDLAILKKALAGKTELTKEQFDKADINNDGSFDLLDCRALKKILAG